MGLLSKIFSNTRKPEGFWGKMMVAGMNGGSHAEMASWGLDFGNVPAEGDILMETLRVLKKGGTFALHDIFSKAKYGDMLSFVKKLKELGYEEVELIPTDNGRFMRKWEAIWMALSGSAVLFGKK